MADEAKIGPHWQDDELDAIVADYFAKLEADLSGQAYIKSNHSKTLMARIGRTHRSVEFKHQNISAVLDELCMPWIQKSPGAAGGIFSVTILLATPAFVTSNVTACPVGIPIGNWALI